jgi:hypothetical protein
LLFRFKNFKALYLKTTICPKGPFSILLLNFHYRDREREDKEEEIDINIDLLVDVPKTPKYRKE